MNKQQYDILRKSMSHQEILDYVNTVYCNNGETFTIATNKETKETYIAHHEPIYKIEQIAIC